MPAPRARVAALCVAVVSTLLGPAAAPPASGADDPFAATEVRLPTVPDGTTIRSVRLDGDTAYAAVNDADSGRSGERILVTASDGSGSWADLRDPTTHESVRGHGLEVGRGVAAVGVGVDSGNCGPYRLIGAAAAGTVQSCDSPTLARRGDYVVPLRLREAYSELRRTSDGSLVQRLEPDDRWPEAYAVDGDVVWWLPVWPEGLRSLDLRTGETRSRAVPKACAGARAHLRAVVAGVVHLDCDGASAVIDTVRGVPPRIEPRLDDIGVVGVEWRDPADMTILEHDPGAAARSWAIVGWNRGVGRRWAYGSRPPTVATDVEDRPAVIVATSPSTASVWTFPISSPFETAPDRTVPFVRFTRSPRTPVAAAGRPLRLPWAWEIHDDQSAGALERIVQVGHADGRRPLTWEDVSSDAQTTSFVDREYRGERTCLRVRARDWAGNLGPWAVSCVVVDAAAPLVQTRMRLELIERRAPLRYTITFRSPDRDNASYEVNRRVAPPGRRLSAWHTPPSWRAIRGNRLSMRMVPGSEVCLRVRGRDRLGNVGEWEYAPGRCALAAYDESTLRITGPHRRTRIPRPGERLIGDTLTEITSASRIDLGHVTGRRIFVALRGNGFSCFRVFVDGVEVPTHCSPGADDAPSRTLVRVRPRHAVAGHVQIASKWDGPFLLDGVAVER